MSDHEESDEQTLPSILAEMSSAPSLMSNAPAAAGQSSWALNSSARRHHTQQGLRHSTSLPRRTTPRGHPQSMPEHDHRPQSTYSPSPNIFNTPSRSIFASGPSAASVSASTVHASISSPPPGAPSAKPLSAFASSNTGYPRRGPHLLPHLPISGGSVARLRDIEKDTEDPTEPRRGRMDGLRRDSGTPAAVSQLFTAPEPTSPPISRHASYTRATSGTQIVRALPAEAAPLPNHLDNRGLLSGRHSDITVIAFGTRYPLHRLLLDRAPYFCSALSEPWLESSSKEITLHPEEIDANITQAAFELALKRIYGCFKEEEEDKEAMGLFATGCWLDMADLIEASLNSLLRQLIPANVSNYIRLVTSNYYGKHGERILAAAKALLCRDGWEMPLCYFDGIVGEIVREVIGSDGFYVPGEWDRYLLAKRLLNRRLKSLAMDAGLVDGSGNPWLTKPDSSKIMTARVDAFYGRSAAFTTNVNAEACDKWFGLYASSDIAPLLALLDEGIYYVHLGFEQLQKIRESRDAMGLPVVPEKIISDALWMSMELRQKIVNAGDSDVELGLAEYIDEPLHPNDGRSDELTSDAQDTIPGFPQSKNPAKNGDSCLGPEEWEASGTQKRFWVPLTDATFPLGGDLEPAASESASSSKTRLTPQISALMSPNESQWNDFAYTQLKRSETPPEVGSGPSPKVRYSHYPPFRFSVEFPSAKNLKEKRRVYSSTVWYAGSLWNMYVQKRVGARHTQLGVYLHRERLPEPSDGNVSALRGGSVDERIGQLEREMVSGRNRRSNMDSRTLHTRDDSASSDEVTPTGQNNANSRPSQDLSTLSGLLRSSRGVMKTSEASLTQNDLGIRPGSSLLDSAGRLDDEHDEQMTKNRLSVPTLPAYFDQRPTTCTFFKIYTPSRSGRVLTVYESKPDTFNFSQSWGWRSSNLILDDALVNPEKDGHHKDSRLRFMVVLGNL